MIHSCDRPKIIYDWRQDNTFHPPEQEKRPRCLVCGWQGKWRKARADLSN